MRLLSTIILFLVFLPLIPVNATGPESTVHSGDTNGIMVPPGRIVPSPSPLSATAADRALPTPIKRPSSTEIFGDSGGLIPPPHQAIHAAMATMSTMQEMPSDESVLSVTLKHSRPTNVENICSSIKDSCPVDPTGVHDLTNFFTNLDIAVGSGRLEPDKYCECIRTNVPHTSEAMNSLKSQLKQNLRSEVNSKLVRDFSLQLEDLHFYFQQQGFEQRLRALPEGRRRSINCINEDDYKRAFNQNQKCQNPRLSDEAKERKLAQIFSSFTDVSTGGLQSILRKVKDDVLMTNLRDADCSSPETYSRVCFDRDRISLARSEVGAIPDRFLTNIFKSESLAQEILSNAKEDGHSPMEALTEMLEKKINENDPGLLQLIDGRTLNNDSLYQKMRGNLSDVDKAQILHTLKQVIRAGINLHPGINHLLDDVNKFEEVSNSFSGNSLITLLERDADKVIEDYSNKCEALTANIAEVVCSTDDDLLNGMDAHDLKEYAEHLGIRDEATKSLLNVIACENPGNSPFMRHLIPGAGLSTFSDYFARATGRKGTYELSRDQKFTNGSVVGQVMAKALRENRSSFSSFSGFDFFETEVNESNLSSNITRNEGVVIPEAVDSVKGQSIKESLTNLPSNNSEQDMNLGQNIYSNSLSNSGISPENGSVSNASNTSRVDPRQELRDFLKSKENEEELDRLMSGTDNSMMQELLQLKAEMESNQKKLLELTAENERLKLDVMKKQMDDLQRERQALDPGEVRRTENSVARRDSPLLSAASIGRNVAPATQVETGGSNSGSGSAAATSGEVSSEGASLSSLNRALLSSASGGAARGPASDSSSDPVVVSASSAKSGFLEVKSQEVGLDLLNYLSNSGTDIQTLINLKTSGVIYKYRVLENGEFVEKEVLIEYGNLNEDVKKIIDKKIAQNKDRSQEVLRLDNEIKELQRVYSYSALRLLLANQVQNNN